MARPDVPLGHAPVLRSSGGHIHGTDLHHLFAVHEFGLGGASAGDTYSVWGPDGSESKCALEDDYAPDLLDPLRPARAPKMGDVIRASPAIDRKNNLVIAASYDHTVRAYNASTGQEYWRFEVPPVPGGVDTRVISSPAVDDQGRIYVGAFNGRFYALETVPPNGTLQWPTVRELWHFDAGAPIWSSPALSNGYVAFGADNGFLYVLDAGSGAFRFQHRTADDVRSSPAIWTGGLPDLPFAGGVLYVGSSDGHLYAFGGEKPRLPDLAIQRLEVPKNLTIGKVVKVQLEVANVGDAVAPATSLDLHIGKVLAARLPVPELYPGFNATLVHEWTVTTGNHTLRAALDAEKRVRDEDRSNNEKVVKTDKAVNPPRTPRAPVRNATTQASTAQAKKSPGPELGVLLVAAALVALAARAGPPGPRPPPSRRRR